MENIETEGLSTWQPRG